MDNVFNTLFDLNLILDNKFIIEKAEFSGSNPFKNSAGAITGVKLSGLISKEQFKIIKESLGQNKYWKGFVNFTFPWGGEEKSFASFKSTDKKEIYAGFVFFDNEEGINEKKENATSFDTLLTNSNTVFSTIISGDNLKNIFYSDSIKLITGYSQSEILAYEGGIKSIIHNEDLQYVLKVLNRALNDNKINKTSFTYRIVKKDKSITWLKEIISLTRNNYGDVVKLASLTFDITEYKTLEENLKSSVDELKSLEASRIRFINILAHDLRAPFTSILGFAEILLNEPSLPDKDRKEYLTYIYDASQNQLGFTNYLLDWARLKSGTIKMETGRLRASDIVYNEVSNLTGNAVRKNIEIKTDISDDIYILADERLLGQVFSNLINNAIKYSKENSIIEVNGNIYNEKYAEFVVKDFGVGLTQEEKKKIFNLEESFTKEGTKGEKGTGLGLALVKEIILKHNGDIWFFSEENNGTEFHFIIPLASRMVLLVESDESVKSIINSIIKKNFSDIELIYADNGFEALNLLGEFFPVLIILNDKLPMMNGLQFIDSARSIFSGFAVPVIFLGDKKTMENMEKLTNKKSVFFSDIAIQENSLLKILNQLID